jgi:hypothetical protein
VAGIDIPVSSGVADPYSLNPDPGFLVNPVRIQFSMTKRWGKFSAKNSFFQSYCKIVFKAQEGLPVYGRNTQPFKENI